MERDVRGARRSTRLNCRS